MAIGYICPCCGEKVTRKDLADADNHQGENEILFVCQPCTADKSPQMVASLLPDLSVYTISKETPVVVLEAQKAFDLLTSKEQQYAYHLGKADWEGAKICLLQCSLESVPIFALFQACFSSLKDNTTIEEWKQSVMDKGIVNKDEISQALLYVAAFYGNMGNYKSFGDTKFIPSIPMDQFKALLETTPGFSQELWDECCDRMYSLPPRQRQMGLGSTKGITNYFSANCDETDAQVANAFLDSIALAADNTRLFKVSSSSSADENSKYEVRLASASTKPYDLRSPTTYTFQETNTFVLTRGDYAPIMQRIVDSLQQALSFTANPNQTAMIEKYMESFTTGNHDAHKDASRFWIKDKGPAVESYIGFIESYRDPSGVRGEWEGFVACVNKEVSRKFQALVDGAETFLQKMPWPKTFEKDTFLRPDFTSLEVLSFGSSGVPAGINIPNYDEIRQREGFKNVSLGNVLQASYSVAPDKAVSFIAPNDQALYKALKGEAFEVQVGIHELLGHGSGKLYHQNTPDAEQLLKNKIVHPITGEPITGPFYAPGATWGSTFGKLSPTYEECRAECSGLYLCLESEILNVFGVDTTTTSKASGEGDIHDVTYINWLLMARAGLTGLEFYTPSTKEWRQAHMQARYVILRILLEAKADGNNDGEEPLLSLKELTGEDGKPDIQVVLNRKLISTVGRKVIGDFLLKLQVYKSLGDVETGSKLYNDYSVVPDDMAKLREIVMARKEPRKLLIQPHMHLDSATGTVTYQSFPATPEGMIQSFVARYPAEDEELLKLYHADKAAMTD